MASGEHSRGWRRGGTPSWNDGVWPKEGKAWKKYLAVYKEWGKRQGSEAASASTEETRDGTVKGAGRKAVKAAESFLATKIYVVSKEPTKEVQRFFGLEDKRSRQRVQNTVRCQRQSLAVEREYGDGAGYLGDVLRTLYCRQQIFVRHGQETRR